VTTKVMTRAMVEDLIAEKLTKQTAISSRDDEHFAAIRRRAYEISEQPDSGSPGENWARAERELTRGSSLQTEGERAPGTHESPSR
jgi:hypothetical protein